MEGIETDIIWTVDFYQTWCYKAARKLVFSLTQQKSSAPYLTPHTKFN